MREFYTNFEKKNLKNTEKGSVVFGYILKHNVEQ
jgi:hypothetical protein